jgi:hypothetical protein
MESSESEAENQGMGNSDDESDASGFVTLGRDLSEDGEVNLDENTFADLDVQAVAYAKIIQSKDGKEAADKTRRLAVVNLDWDHVCAAHLYKIFSSLVQLCPLPFKHLYQPDVKKKYLLRIGSAGGEGSPCGTFQKEENRN